MRQSVAARTSSSVKFPGEPDRIAAQTEIHHPVSHRPSLGIRVVRGKDFPLD